MPVQASETGGLGTALREKLALEVVLLGMTLYTGGLSGGRGTGAVVAGAPGVENPRLEKTDVFQTRLLTAE